MLLAKIAKLMKVDFHDFVINNKDQIMESLLENEDFEQVGIVNQKYVEINFFKLKTLIVIDCQIPIRESVSSQRILTLYDWTLDNGLNDTPLLYYIF